MLHMIQRHLRRGTKERMRTHDDSSHTAITEDATNKDTPKFPHFAELNEDLQRIIISFIASAPNEILVHSRTRRDDGTYEPSALTRILPLVNKAFQRMADDDENWRAALIRQLANDERDHLWKAGLRRMLPLDFVANENSLLSDVRNHLGSTVSHKEIYKKVLTRHIKFEAPMFLMPCAIRLQEMYGLHLFEPRYRRMIHDIMEACDNPEEARRGAPIVPGVTEDGILQPPLLIHFCLPQHLRAGATAALVQVAWCRTYEHGTADVQLMPVGWVKIERIWCRRDQGDLFYANATRLE